MSTEVTDKQGKQSEKAETSESNDKVTETQGMNASAISEYLSKHPEAWDQVKVKKGQEEVSFGEGVNRGLRQADYTRKTQELAEQKKALAENRPALTKDEIKGALFDEETKEPPSPFVDPEQAAKWGEQQIVDDPVGYARALAAEAARQRRDFDSRLKKEVDDIRNDIKVARANEGYQRDLANVRAVVPDFSEEKQPALWHLAHQAWLGQNTDKPNAMLEGKIPNTMTFSDVVVGVKKHLVGVGKTEFDAQQAAAKKRKENAVTLGPNSATEVSYPAEIEAIEDIRARMKARGEYLLRIRSGESSG